MELDLSVNMTYLLYYKCLTYGLLLVSGMIINFPGDDLLRPLLLSRLRFFSITLKIQPFKILEEPQEYLQLRESPPPCHLSEKVNFFQTLSPNSDDLILSSFGLHPLNGTRQ